MNIKIGLLRTPKLSNKFNVREAKYKVFVSFYLIIYTIKFFVNFTGFDVEYSATIVGISQRSFPGYLEFVNPRVCLHLI